MCGIVGYVGPANPANVIVSGLRRLEYRGYDSAGIALCHTGKDGLLLVKTPGKISALEEKLNQVIGDPGDWDAAYGIGHTRWATHGAPTELNAHPHVSRNGRFAIVHNGIIENYVDLKRRLSEAGYEFSSETDSEVIAHLVEECYDGDLRAALASAIARLEGTFGILLVSPDHPDTLVAARKGSPIAVGLCEGETVVASDVSAIVSHSDKVVFLDDGDILLATPQAIEITSASDVPVSRETTQIDWDVGRVQKAGYEHFMLKEIFEQPEAIANATRGRLIADDGTTLLSGLRMDPLEMAAVSRITLAACGTSLYAGMVGQYCFEDFAGLPAGVEQAAEFRYRNPIIQQGTCVIAISQSGETADTLAAVREARRKGALVLAICNAVGSTIAREAGRGAYLHAGPEIGVASTKAFCCQVSVLAMMAIAMGRTRRLSAPDGRHMVGQLAALPDIARRVLDRSDEIREIAAKYADVSHFFFIGRGYMYPAALEGALKLKEISYIHAEGYHAAELKHGPIALLEERVPVMALIPDIAGRAKTLGNLQECRARSAPVIAVATEGDEEAAAQADDVILVPPCPDFLSAVPVVIAEQLFAYHVADIRGCPIDQPRNLAKSVTVE